MLVAKKPMSKAEVAKARIAVPGKMTSAFLALQLWLERPAKDFEFVVVPFDEIFKAVREGQGLTLAEVAGRMGIDPPALSRLETGKMLNPTLATLHKWAEALGQKLDVGLSSA